MTIKVLLAPGAREVTSRFETVKSAAWLPSTTTAKFDRVAVPMFLMVRNCETPAVPRIRDPNSNAASPSMRFVPPVALVVVDFTTVISGAVTTSSRPVP